MGLTSVAQFGVDVVDLLAEEDSELAASLGVPSDGLTDYSPAAWQRRTEVIRDQLERANALEPVDEGDRIARDVIIERLSSMLALASERHYLRDLNILTNPAQGIRTTVELMLPSQGVAEVADRLRAVPRALTSWRESLLEGAALGEPAAQRQSVAVAQQMDFLGRDWLPGLLRDVPGGDDLYGAAEAAAAAFATTSTWLADVYVGMARPDDAVGEEALLLHAQFFTGMEVDLDEAFRWGLSEIDRVAAEMRREVQRIEPGLVVSEARDYVAADPRYRLTDVAELEAYVRQLTKQATDELDGTIFTIDPRVRELDIKIAGEGDAGLPYYLPPSEDLSRLGSVWLPVSDIGIFDRFWLESMWFHEGIPGHHLQLGAVAVHQGLNRFQRTLGATSGHDEGWACYAEVLCDELGWFEDPAVRLGHLSWQMVRAIRVVADIGLHTGREIPHGYSDAGARITPDFVSSLLRRRASATSEFAISEVNRCLGAPGQAMSYKLGEREWLAARTESEKALGSDFDLKKWHDQALRLGPMGLAQFRREMTALNR